MRTIYKYPIVIQPRQVLPLPDDYKILHIELQDGVPCLWADIDTENPITNCVILMFGTGWELPRSPIAHIATLQVGIYVWHFYTI